MKTEATHTSEFKITIHLSQEDLVALPSGETIRRYRLDDDYINKLANFMDLIRDSCTYAALGN